ncbi:NAD dependent epimerase/dehydratase [Fasciolopsis buskii]|uniref:NAD dependent epimerase/dehydratase n=1 Tax=Fasciolopsis buskii TaxID=27845 RepID=A0A8E0S1R8_9TREM|nr:NAD dependent epimerase/dehydratase [Fasciolopsis buski]
MMTENKTEADHYPLLVIGAGIGRTGTTSLKCALEILYQMPCYHMTTVVYEHQNHVQLWIKLYDLMEQDPNGDLPEDVIREIFRGYSSTTDNPGCTIYKQLMKMYPDAKVWLNEILRSICPIQKGLERSVRSNSLLHSDFD